MGGLQLVTCSGDIVASDTNVASREIYAVLGSAERRVALGF
jgi:hypothetical protein